MRVFFHFLKFESYVPLDIAYNDSLGQSLTSSRGKTHEKNLCLNQVQSEIFPHVLEFGPYFFFEIEYDDS